MRKGEGTKESPGWTEEETEDRNDSNSDRDQDSDISFMNDGDEEIDTAEIEEEAWFDYVKRSTAAAIER